MKPARARSLLLVVVVGVLAAGCAADVTMVNPRTAERVVCRESLRGLDPWSQKAACVGDYTARGWTRAIRE